MSAPTLAHDADDEVTTVVCRDGTVLPLRRVGSRDASQAIILCHGFIQNSRAFSVPRHSLPRFLADAGFAVYLMELRGRRARVVNHDLATTIDDDAATVVAAVAAAHRQVAWVGHSMGGLIGTALDAHTAARIDAVVAIGSPLFPGRSVLHRKRVLSSLVGFGRTMGRRAAPFDGARYSRGFVAGRRVLAHPLSQALPLSLWRPGSFRDDADLHHTLAASFANDSHHVLADLVDLVVTGGVHAGRVNMARRLGALRAPLLAIAGSVDALAPPDSVHALYARAASATKEYLEIDAGHIDLVVGDDAPRLVWQPLLTFITNALAVAAP